MSGTAKIELSTPAPSGAASPDASVSATPSPAGSAEASDGTHADERAGPQIYAATASPGTVHAGESITFLVRTSTDVATVTATVSAYSLPLVRTAPGRFALTFAIPQNVPFFFHGTYAMNMIAREKSGSSASRSVDVTFR